MRQEVDDTWMRLVVRVRMGVPEAVASLSRGRYRLGRKEASVDKLRGPLRWRRVVQVAKAIAAPVDAVAHGAFKMARLDRT
jgi:hypothetical protein